MDSKINEPVRFLENLQLNSALGAGYNNMFGFLNDTHAKYPHAISLVAGMPDESFFNVEEHLAAFYVFADYLSGKAGKDRYSAINQICQYGSSKGMINDILARYLSNDEDINVTGKDILVTVGAQEAFAILVAALCDREKDVLLIESPGYVGMSAVAKILGQQTEGVSMSDDGIDLDSLENKILEVNNSARRVKLLYTIPDYQNPSGCCLSNGKRKKLIELAGRYNFLIVEDAVYSSFSYSGDVRPSLKALDNTNRVLYVCSFSKLLFPGMRMGMIVAGQEIKNDRGEIVSLIDELEKVKGVFTNNTPGITQAMVAGALLKENFSLKNLNREKIAGYRQKRDTILLALERYIRSYEQDWSKDITWNDPAGGFFIKISLPFSLSNEDVLNCADQYGVLFCPMSYFYIDGGGNNEIRLAFSKCSLAEAEEGIKRLAHFLQGKAIQHTAAHARVSMQVVM